MRILAVDGGKSATRAVVTDDGVTIGAATGPGFVYPPGGSADDELVRVVTRTWDRLPAAARRTPDRAVLALTGCPDDPAALDAVRQHVATAVGATDVLMVGDVVAAHAGALGEPGVVVVAGTGSIALAVGPDGDSQRADGWGPLLGDAGGGYAVGRAGLRAAYEAADGRGPATVLTAYASSRLGGLDLDAARRLLGRADLVPFVSSFAAEVAGAALAGDAVARAILASTAAALAASAVAAAQAVRLRPPVPVSWAGRLFDAGAPLLEPFAEQVRRSGMALARPRGGVLAGALRLATRPALYAEVNGTASSQRTAFETEGSST